MKKVLIVGITGQDGSLLNNFLLSKNIKVFGLSRKKNKSPRVIKTDYSYKSLKKIIIKIKPDEVYNFSGFSRPSSSWDHPFENFKSNFETNLFFLEIIKSFSNKKIKYFNSSSSEIFQETNNKLTENSKIFPINPYGIAKSASHFLVNAYRKKYNMYVVSGILFNHESYKNSEKYLLKYLLKSSKKIKQKKIKKIILSDSRPIRDFGCAKDYVKCIYYLMQLKKSDDYIIATGKSYSIAEIANLFKEKFKLKTNQVVFKNEFDFKFLNKIKKADNKKLLKSLKSFKFKNINQLIQTLTDDD